MQSFLGVYSECNYNENVVVNQVEVVIETASSVVGNGNFLAGEVEVFLMDCFSRCFSFFLREEGYTSERTIPRGKLFLHFHYFFPALRAGFSELFREFDLKVRNDEVVTSFWALWVSFFIKIRHDVYLLFINGPVKTELLRQL